MSYSQTPRLKLWKPNAGSNQDVDLTKINESLDRIDAGGPPTVCTSATRPNPGFLGQLIYETNTGKVQMCTVVGPPSTWAEIPFLSAIVATYETKTNVAALSKGVLGTPAENSNVGTVTSAATEVRDAVLGDYVFTAVANRKYRLHYHGRMRSSITENCSALVRIRDGGAVTPTTASTEIAHTVTLATVAGDASAERTEINEYLGTTTFAAGIHVLSAFTLRLTGTGTITPVGPREIYVEDVGAA